MALGAILFVHVVLALTYANVTPYRTPGFLSYARTRPWSPVPDIGAPDERQHANYVIHILEGEGLPVNRVYVTDPSRPGQMIRNPRLDEEYEFHQAPLFYIIDAAFARLAGIDATSASDRQLGKRLRYINALFGALNVLGIYFLALWGLSRRDIAFLSASIAALLPMNVALSGAVSNDPLLFCLCSWALAFCAKGIQTGWTPKVSIAVGVTTGLALLTKETALALIPVVLLAFYLVRAKPPRALATSAVALLLALPLWVRNQMLYGDPFGLKSFQQLFAGAVKTQDMVAENGFLNHWINYVGWYTARSFFGVFGYMDIFLNERGNSYTGPADLAGPAAPNTLYRVLLVLAVLGLFGFLLSLRKPLEPFVKKAWWLNAAFFAVITLLFIRYNVSLFQGQARYFFPALGPICIGLAAGALYWAKSASRLVIGTLIACLIALNVYALARLPAEFEKRIDPAVANLVP